MTCSDKTASRPISRVLSWTAIHLRLLSPATCSDLPEGSAGHAVPSYLVLLRVGFTLPQNVTICAVRSYRTISPLPLCSGGMLSVALAVGLRLPGVTWHPALWSPDFPPPAMRQAAAAWPTRRGIVSLYHCKFNGSFSAESAVP